MQFCTSNSLHAAAVDNFIKTVLLECINERYQVDHYRYMLYHMMTVLLEYIDFTTIFHKCLILLLMYTYFPALCLMLSMTYYAQNYTGIIGESLVLFPLIKLMQLVIPPLIIQVAISTLNFGFACFLENSMFPSYSNCCCMKAICKEEII